MKSARLKTTVLDANVVLGVLEGRSGAERARNLISQAAEGRMQLLMSVINWGEVYYTVWRKRGLQAAETVLQQITELRVQVVNADPELTKLAATFHAKYKLPYADCFAAALAQQRRATLATGDSDFARVEKQVKVLWTTEQ